MRAIQLTRTGGPEVLAISSLADPVPGPGEVLIRVHTAGVNFIDTYFREGKYKQNLPFVLGEEGSGHVASLGEGVTELEVGDAVSWIGPNGSYAELVVLNGDRVFRIPEGVDLQIAAAIMMQGVTAQYLAYSTFPLKAGDTALIHAAAGGVGSLLAQMAASLDVRVLATVSTDEKAAIARNAGAREVIRYDQVDFDTETRRLTDGAGVDVVYDGVGKSTFEKSLNCIRPLGLLALYGAASGPVPPFDLQRLSTMGSLFVTRPLSADYVRTSKQYRDRVEMIFKLYQEGKLKVRVDEVFPLDQAAAAHSKLEARKTIGKLLLSVGA
jgi:NADPH2:quinone reductase